MYAALFLTTSAFAGSPTGDQVLAFSDDGRCTLLALAGPTFTLVCEDAAPVSVSPATCPADARGLAESLRARGVKATVDPAACGSAGLVTAPPLTRPDTGARLEVGELTVTIGRTSPASIPVDPGWMAVRAVADTQLVVVLLAPTQAQLNTHATVQGVYVPRDGRTMRIWGADAAPR